MTYVWIYLQISSIKKNLIFVIPYLCSLNSEEKRRRRRRKSFQTFFVMSKLKFEWKKEKRKREKSVSRLLLCQLEFEALGL